MVRIVGKTDRLISCGKVMLVVWAVVMLLCLAAPVGNRLAQAQSDIVLQPGPGEGKDIWTTSVFSYAPGGGGPGGGLDNEWLEMGGWGDLYYILIEFDLTNLPPIALSARIDLFVGKSKGNGTTGVYLDRITAFWDWRIQGTGSDRERLWWADRPSATQWIPGSLPAPTVGQWYSIDITDLYNAWKAGTYPNYGVQLRPVSNSNRWNEFYSSDYLDNPSLRPKLVIQVPSAPLIADFSCEPESGPAPLTVQFTNNSTGDIDTCAWDFGDGTAIVTGCDDQDHTYTTPGTYTVSLTVTGPDGTDTETKVDYITVSPRKKVYLVPSIEDDRMCPSGCKKDPNWKKVCNGKQEGYYQNIIAQKVKEKLEAFYDIKIFEGTPKNCKKTQCMQQSEIGKKANNWGADVLVSFHTNAGPGGCIGKRAGTITFWECKETDYTLAQTIHNAVIESLEPLRNAKGITSYVKKFEHWWNTGERSKICKSTTKNCETVASNIKCDYPDWYIADKPACLIESLFHDNLKESEILHSDEGQKAIAQGIANGIKEFLGD